MGKEILVTEQTLFEGAWWALEQAVRLLNSAVILFDSGDHGSAVALAMFGREELGRSRLLQKFAEKVRKGDLLDTKAVITSCDDHVTKQRASALSTTLRIQPNTVLSGAFKARIENKPCSKEWKDADAKINEAIRAKKTRAPSDWHNDRIRGLYVDLNQLGSGWHRPVSIDRSEACDEIYDAINNYSLACDHLDEDRMSLNVSKIERLKANAVQTTDIEREIAALESLVRMGKAKQSIGQLVNLPLPVWPKSVQG